VHRLDEAVAGDIALTR